ncbi:phosphoglycolate phosphatase [Rhabdaerophilum calidifontis]|uniref:phosphoglycolate phosphatase n=1 Tax=Rhabdaerophilum calidifontis TaxID=2604328 RepID=UPI001238BAF3|nr:phosphoglycolate phosphatase [Rhabdaerophilum calidifontis]
MPATLVFDLDGTLAETAPDIMAALNHFLLREGLEPLPLAAARSLVGAGARALIERGFRAAGRPLATADLDRIFAALLDHYLENIAVRSHLFPGVEAALDTLAAAGHRFAICTNKPEPHARALVEALGILPRFAALAGRETFPFCKPDPRHLTETVRQAGGDPARAILIGDSRTDIDTARAAGLPVIGVTFGYSDVPMAELAPDRLIGHFDALPAAIADLGA